jgi:hypothetical protein
MISPATADETADLNADSVVTVVLFAVRELWFGVTSSELIAASLSVKGASLVSHAVKEIIEHNTSNLKFVFIIIKRFDNLVNKCG